MGGVLNSPILMTMTQLDIRREYHLTDEQFRQVREQLYSVAGIALPDHKKNMVHNRLVRRLRATNQSSFDDYFDYLEAHEQELPLFINALTTNLTSFFREMHHFDFLKEQIVPEIRQHNNRKLRFWSAGCSMGEEAYSLAISLLDAGIDPMYWDLKILATDIDSNVLSIAEQGIYDQDRSNNLSESMLRRWFYKGKGAQKGMIRVKPELQQLIRFRHLNLMDDWPMDGAFDAIFCRNVMIYFDPPTQQVLLERMAEKLKDGGYLFVGHSESLIRQQRHFQLIGRTIYRKVEAL